MVHLKAWRQFHGVEILDGFGSAASKLLVFDLRDTKLLTNRVELVPQIPILPGMFAAARFAPRTEIGKADRDKQASK